MNGTIRLAMTASLGYAAYIAWSCPCEQACKCKFIPFLVSTGVPLAYVLWANIS